LVELNIVGLPGRQAVAAGQRQRYDLFPIEQNEAGVGRMLVRRCRFRFCPIVIGALPPRQMTDI
jgi:hypothetical protein